MLRITIAVLFLVVSAGLIWIAFLGDPSALSASLLVNLGTEVFGILVTVAVVEWIFERRRLQDRARELAWNTLHLIERGIWVWQGGPRRLGTEELLGLVSAVAPDDELTPYTRSLLVNLGIQCKDALHKEAPAVRSLPGLAEAFQELTSLSTIQDGGSSVSMNMVVDVLDSGLKGVARILGQPTGKMPARLIRYRDASAVAQERRYFDGAPPGHERWTDPGADSGQISPN